LFTPGISTGYWNPEKQPRACALLSGEREEVLAFEGHGAAGDFIVLATREDLRQRALAGTIGPHDGVYLAGSDLEIDALKDVLARNASL
jgi:hypothetical protein